jgi:hypothetical protein
MCDDVPEADRGEPGRMSFTESVSILDCKPKEIDFDKTIVFFNDSDQFDWRVSDDLCDMRTGVICSPNNYLYNSPDEATKLPDGAVYGAPKKRLDGKTHLDNVFICGTDQGFVGIVGAIVSGISIANQHLLKAGT